MYVCMYVCIIRVYVCMHDIYIERDRRTEGGGREGGREGGSEAGREDSILLIKLAEMPHSPASECWHHCFYLLTCSSNLRFPG